MHKSAIVLLCGSFVLSNFSDCKAICRVCDYSVQFEFCSCVQKYLRRILHSCVLLFQRQLPVVFGSLARLTLLTTDSVVKPAAKLVVVGLGFSF